MWVPKSRSPKPNHCGSSPYAASTLDAEGLLGAPPTLILGNASTEGVEQSVDVGADPQTEQRDVVPGVGDDRQGRFGEFGGGVQRVAQPAEEACSTDSTGQCRDSHGAILAYTVPALDFRGTTRV